MNQPSQAAARPWQQATDFEFRYRFWVFGLIFSGAFWLYFLDRVNAGVALAGLVFTGVDLDSPGGRHALEAVFGAGALLAFAAAGLRTWASAYLRSEVIHDPNVRTEHLVADGPYRFVRNPLYLANQLLAMSMAPMASRIGSLVLLFVILVFHLRLIAREEAELLASQGESYRAFLQAVPRFWPAFRPRLASSGRRPRWGQAFLGEAFFWAIAAGCAAFAVTLHLPLTVWIVAASMILYGLLLPVWKKQRGAQPKGR